MKTMEEKVLLDVRNFSKHTEMLELVESREPKKKKIQNLSLEILLSTSRLTGLRLVKRAKSLFCAFLIT